MNCNELRKEFNLVDKVNYFIQTDKKDFEFNRKIIRDNIVDLFKNEPAGTGKGALSTRTIYCVEKINSEIIYLKRPATLNNGFDFEIHTKTKQFNGRIKSRPRHEDIFASLNILKNTNISLFNQVQIVIDEIYFCNEINIQNFKDTINNIQIETILKLIKWLFIEQDITYWNFSGRNMLYKGLKSI